MIQAHILKAKNNMITRKNGTFLEGELYFGRISKDGTSYVVRSEEGYWIPISNYKETIMRNYLEYFDVYCWFLCENRKWLNQIDSVTLLLDRFYDFDIDR